VPFSFSFCSDLTLHYPADVPVLKTARHALRAVHVNIAIQVQERAAYAAAEQAIQAIRVADF
jgi:hypothetical protein